MYCIRKSTISWARSLFSVNPIIVGRKGSVEQVNGLIRRYLPKGTNFNNVTAAEINRIERRLNNRPRKMFKLQNTLRDV